jgi:hypothetical protein
VNFLVRAIDKIIPSSRPRPLDFELTTYITIIFPSLIGGHFIQHHRRSVYEKEISEMCAFAHDLPLRSVL